MGNWPFFSARPRESGDPGGTIRTRTYSRDLDSRLRGNERKSPRTVIERRMVLLGTGSLAVIAGLTWMRGSAGNAAGPFEVEKSDDEWRRLLKPAQYRVLRQHGTEQPFSSPLNGEKRKGTFACAGCALPLFASDTKFESGTGWPSFYAPLPNAVATADDRSLLIPRTEVHCRRCGGHLGHVFNDGPPPTRLRYCMNGVALTFVPAADAPA
jgi:peptide-methionine (R)-S-oxide reductase